MSSAIKIEEKMHKEFVKKFFFVLRDLHELCWLSFWAAKFCLNLQTMSTDRDGQCEFSITTRKRKTIFFCQFVMFTELFGSETL